MQVYFIEHHREALRLLHFSHALLPKKYQCLLRCQDKQFVSNTNFLLVIFYGLLIIATRCQFLLLLTPDFHVIFIMIIKRDNFDNILAKGKQIFSKVNPFLASSIGVTE